MASLRIDIDGESLDINQDQQDAFYITRQIHDITDLSTRNADFSKQINVPTTAKNILILESQTLFSIAQTDAIEAIPCNIILDGVTVAINASLFVSDITNKDQIAINILYGNFTFFDQLVGSIKDLDFTSEVFEYTMTGITGKIPIAVTSIADAGNSQITISFSTLDWEQGQQQVGDVIVLDNDNNGYNFQTGRVVATGVGSVLAAIPFTTATLPATLYAYTRDTLNNPSKNLTTSVDKVSYPFMDWFNSLETNPLPPDSVLRLKQDIELAGFAFMCKDIIEKMVTDAGFTTNLIGLPDLYSEIAIACPNPLFVLQTSTSELGEQESPLVAQDFDASIAGSVTSVVDFRIEVVINPSAPFDTLATEMAYTWTALPNNVIVQTTLNVNVIFASASGQVEFRILKNNVAVATRTFITSAGTLSFILEFPDSAQTNDKYQVQVFAEDGPGGNDGHVEVLTGSNFQIGVGGGTVDRTISNPANFFPDIAKEDFLKGILNMMNLIIVTDSLKKEVRIQEFKGILENQEQELNLDVSSEFTSSSAIGSFFRQNKFQYIVESGFARLRQDVDATFPFDDERLQPTGVVIQLPFSACDNSNLYDKTGYKQVAVTSAYQFNAGVMPADVTWDFDTSFVTIPEDEDFTLGEYIGYTNELRRVTDILSPTLLEVSGIWIQGKTISANTGTTRFIMTDADQKGKLCRVIPNSTSIYERINDNGVNLRLLFSTAAEVNVFVIGDNIRFTTPSDETFDAGVTGVQAGNLRIITDLPFTTVLDKTGPSTVINLGGGDVNYLGEGFINEQTPVADEQGELFKVGLAITDGVQGVFDDPMLWTNLVDNQYLELLTALRRPLIITVQAFLTETEFYSLDFLRPVYLSVPFGGQFYINRISQYKSGQPVRFTLVRISKFGD